VILVSQSDLRSAGFHSDYPEDFRGTGFAIDSRKVKRGDIFIGLDGVSQKGADFALMALEKGAVAALLPDSSRRDVFKDRPVFFSKDFFSSLGQLLYGGIDPKLFPKIVAVTGTNGKTTIAWSLAQALRGLGQSAVYAGTIGIDFGNGPEKTGLTTPDILTISSMVHKAAQEKIPWIILEASSHGIEQGRLAGLPLFAALFTNLTPDHLDYHKTMENYFSAKSRLFEEASSETFFIINTEDQYGDQLYQKYRGRLRVTGIGKEAVLENMHPALEKSSATLSMDGNSFPIVLPLPGRYNILNSVFIFLVLMAAGFEPQIVLRQLAEMSLPPGRMEKISISKNRLIVVDYAHTPDAISKAIDALRESGTQTLSIVLGAGGDRDKEKRPLMGKAASKADVVYLTSDNPRSENPMDIIAQIQSGVRDKKTVIEPDRKKAFERAISELPPGGVLLLAGKGHENTQQIGDTFLPFNDAEVVREIALAES